MSTTRRIAVALAASALATAGLAVAPLGLLTSPVSAHEPGDPHLLVDVNQVGRGYEIREIAGAGDDAYFSARTDARGWELYFHDASEGTTRLVKDINPGPASSEPAELTYSNGALYFSATDPEHGRELWKTDGTLAGTVLVADIRPGPDGSGPQSLVVGPAGMLFFAADDGVTNEATHPGKAELWRHIGNATNLAAASSNATDVSDLTVLGTRIFMKGVRVNADHGRELIRYSPTVPSLQEFDVLPGAASSEPGQITAAGSTLFFAAGPNGQRQLWRMKNAGNDSVDPFEAVDAWDPGQITARGDGLGVWLSAAAAPGGAVSLYVVAGGMPFAFPTLADPLYIATRGPFAFASADSSVGHELWAAAPPPEAPDVIGDIAPGPASSTPVFVMPLGGGKVATYASFELMYRVALVDPATTDVVEYSQLSGMNVQRNLARPAPDGSGGWWLVASSPSSGWGLWHLASDGTLTEASTPPSGTAGSDPALFTAFGEGVMFFATDGTSLTRPHFHFPPVGSTVALTGTPPSGNPGGPPGGAAVVGDTYFWSSPRPVVNDQSRRLWAGNAIAGSAHVVSDTAGDPTFGDVTALAAFGAGVLFRASAPGTGSEPWFSDGTQGGTTPLGDLVPGAGDSEPRLFTPLGDLAVFSAATDLWVTDGTPGGTQLLADTNSAATSAVVAEGRAWFGTATGVWSTDGTVNGTLRVAMHPNPTTDPAVALTLGEGRIWAAGDGELWLIDPLTGEATEVPTPGGLTFGDPGRRAEVGGRLVFVAAEGSPSALYTSDGETVTRIDPTSLPAGFSLPGISLGVPAPVFAAHHEYVYFAASTDEHGSELWRTDGTAAGTRRITDIAPNALDSHPRSITAIGDRLYFAATTSQLGSEPYYLDLTAGSDPDSPVFVAVEPQRMWDTRDLPTSDGQFRDTGRLSGGASFTVQIAGRGDVPTGAKAVAANLAVVDPGAPGYATLYPCTPDVPTASHVNYFQGDVLANNAVVPLNADGEVCVFTLADADFVLDVNGYVPSSAVDVGIEPARYLDTRIGEPVIPGGPPQAGPVPAGQFVEIQIAGRGDVPADAVAAIVNVTAVFPADAGYLTLYPCTPTVPTTSTVNYFAGTVVPNGAVVSLSPTGSLCVFALAATDIALDVSGYVPSGVATVELAEPARLHDSRTGEPVVDGPVDQHRLAAGETIEVQVTGRAGVPIGAQAAFFNVGAVFPDGPGYATLSPCGTQPETSNLNFATGGTVRANNAFTKLSPDGKVCVYSLVATDVILDLTGWTT